MMRKRLLLVPVLASLACFTEPTVVEPSVVVTLPATGVSGTTATLAGTVNPHGARMEGWFEWGRDSSLSGSVVTPARTIEPAGSDVALSAELTRLEPGDTYYYRAVASSSRGTVNGAIVSFTTPVPPTAYTAQYDLVGNTSNVVQGFVWPNGTSTLAWFEYGREPTLTEPLQTATRPIGSGAERVDLAETLPGLQPYTTYYVRVVASNVGGMTTGNIAWFTTGGAPDIVSSGSYPTGNCDATNLYAFASPNGAETEGWFEYSPTLTMADYATSPTQNLGAGTTRPVSFRVVLPMSGPFYFRAVVRNWLGTARDAVQRASTDGCGSS